MDKPYRYNIALIGTNNRARRRLPRRLSKYLGGTASRPRRRSTENPSIRIWNRKKPPFKSLDRPMYLTGVLIKSKTIFDLPTNLAMR